MKLHLLLVAGVLLLWSSVAWGDVIQAGSLRAQDESNGVSVRWTSLDETGVAGYMVERKTGGSGTFVPMISHAIPVKGNSQNYLYDDETAFRTTSGNFYQYRITPVNSSGQAVGASYYVSIDKNVSSVRRTWGSIKAMFR